MMCVMDSKLDLGTGDFTISLWFKGAATPDKTPGSGSWRWLVNNGGPDSSDDNGLVIATQWGRIRVSMGRWFTDVFDTDRMKTIFNNTDWYHIALTRSGATVSVYVNGELEQTGTSSATIASHPITFGQRSSPDDGGLNGALDDIAVWSQALTPTQIKALADGKATVLNVLQVDPSRPNKDHRAGVPMPAAGKKRRWQMT